MPDVCLAAAKRNRDTGEPDLSKGRRPVRRGAVGKGLPIQYLVGGLPYTETRDISPRLKTILDRAGVRSVVLKANTIAPDRREEWVAARVTEGLDVLITHPRLVATGLDLVAFQTVVWLEIDYSVYVLRQASRRVWRIGQDQPVEVVHLVYQDTLQAEALALVAAKMRSALMVEGELPEDGLAALEGDGQEMVLALARQFTAGSAQDGQSLEALFAQAQVVEAEANDYLVQGEWATDDAGGIAGVSVSSVRLDGGAAGDAIAVVWDQVLRGQPAEPVGALAPPARDGNGRVMSFEELAELVQRRRPRRRAAPEGQLALF